MNKVNIYEAKARLSEFIDAVERGERVVICRRNRPVAELRPIAAGRTAPRPIGAARGHVQIPAAFFDPLPNERVDDFYAGVSAPLAAASLLAERVPATRLSAMRRTRRQRRPRK